MKFAAFFMAEYANMITVPVSMTFCSWAAGRRCFRRRLVRISFRP